MRRKSWIAIAVVLVFAVGVAMTLVLIWPPTPGPTYANYSRIEKGMTRQQVRALMGEPSFEPQNNLDEFGNKNGDIIQIYYDDEGHVAMLLWNLVWDDRTALEKL